MKLRNLFYLFMALMCVVAVPVSAQENAVAAQQGEPLILSLEDALKIASKKHDIVSIRITDDREKELPDLGMVKIYDPETQQTLWVDTSSKEVRNNFADAYNQHSNYVSEVFRKYGIDNVEISTGQDYVKQLMRLFKQRERKL